MFISRTRAEREHTTKTNVLGLVQRLTLRGRCRESRHTSGGWVLPLSKPLACLSAYGNRLVYPVHFYPDAHLNQVTLLPKHVELVLKFVLISGRGRTSNFMFLTF
jgi:hypothetical protein